MIDLYSDLRLGDLPAHAARHWGEREALVFQDRRWTFAELNAEVERHAVGLLRAGIRAGDHVALWFTNRPDYIFLFFAISKVGAVAVPLNTRYRRQDVAYCLAQAHCNALIYAERSGPVDYREMIETVFADATVDTDTLKASGFPHLRRVLTIGPSTLPVSQPLEEYLAPVEPTELVEVNRRNEAVRSGDVAMIVYTSGTTGDAKGVMLTHAGIRLCIQRSVIWGTTFRDVQIHYLPMFHLYALGFVTVPSVALGVSQVLMETFDGEDALRTIARERATIVHGFDPHYRDLMDAQSRLQLDISSLRIGSFPSGPDNCVPVVRAAHECFCPIVPSFGMTETWSGITAGALDCSLQQRSEASGFPLPGVEIRIVDPETGEPLPAGQTGEIQVRSFSLMKGYYDKPEETAAALGADGFLRTGDAGHLRPDGYLRFTGRYKDMLKVGGENVAPAEIELILSELDGVREIACVGYPDPRLQEVVAAFVVPHTGRAAPTLDEVQASCRGRIASFKIPCHVFSVDGFPMTPSGKIQKSKLREVAAADYRRRNGADLARATPQLERE